MNPARIRKLQRRTHIIQMMQVGNATVDEIATVLGIHRQAVLREIALCERIEDQSHRIMVGRMRQIHHERLEDLQAKYWSDASEGKTRAAKVILEAMSQQAKLLGLNAPEQKEFKVNGQVDLGLEQLNADQRQALRAKLITVAEPVDEVEAEEAEVLQIAEHSEDFDYNE